MTALTIGRNKDCNICINDQTVSRLHATLIIDGNFYTIQDEASSNGTFVNGNRIYGKCTLRETDIVKVGNSIVPWKKYIGASAQAQVNGHASADKFISPPPSKKKKQSFAWLVSLLIVAALALFVAFFFYKSSEDELRLAATWNCTGNCGTLQQLVLKKITAGNGDYNYITRDSNSVKGTWSINQTDKTLHLKPGILTATSGFTSFSEEVYKYSFNKKVLSLTRYESGATTGNEITLVKQP